MPRNFSWIPGAKYFSLVYANKPSAAKRLVARRETSRLILRRIVTPPAICPACVRVPRNSWRMHAHHIDYELPVCFVWRCVDCHTAIHLYGQSIPEFSGA